MEVKSPSETVAAVYLHSSQQVTTHMSQASIWAAFVTMPCHIAKKREFGGWRGSQTISLFKISFKY